MYCGAGLPSDDHDPQAPALEVSAEERGARARALLDGLKLEARALLPADVLARLEADAELSPSEAAPPPRHLAAPPPPRSAPRLVFSRPTPEPEPAFSDLPMNSFESLDDLPPANQEEGTGSFEATLLEALGRGGGPFGPRKASWRLILLPSSSYRDGLPWLKPRLAATAGIDAYTAVQYLQRQVPSYLGSDHLPGPLREQARDLEAAGLRVVVLARREWARERLPRLVADVRDLDADPLEFVLEEGDPIGVPRATLRWAATASIQPVRDRSHVEVGRTRWGLPRVPDRVGLSDRFTPYYALDLFLSDGSRPLRIRSNGFDFRRLGEERAIAAAINIRRLASRFGARQQPIDVDEGFRKVPSLPGPEEREEGGEMKAGTLPRREVDFTEYGLLLDEARTRD